MSLLGIPAFVLAVLMMYWSPTVISALYYCKWADFKGRRNDPWAWAAFLVGYFRIRTLRVGSNDLYRGGKCVYLINHRSWADFFLDLYLTEGRAAMLSRMIVFFLFPCILCSSVTFRAIILFKRQTIADKKAFNEWLHAKIAASPLPGLLVYPEGHRSTRPQSLPLRRGMLRFAYDYRLPVQIMICAGKEAVLAEKKQRVRFGATLTTGFSGVIRPEDCADFEAFFTAIQVAWDKQWAAVYGASPAGLPEHKVQPPMYDYPFGMRLLEFVKEIVWFTIAALNLSLLSKACAGVAALLGAHVATGLGVVLLAWIVASMASVNAFGTAPSAPPRVRHG